MRKIILITFLLFSIQGLATDKWFKATTGNNWGTLANWYTNSIWTVSASELPRSIDSVAFIAGAGNCVIDVSASCYSANFTGYNGTLSGSSAWSIYGGLIAGGTWTYSGTLTFAATSGSWKITFAGKSLSNITFNGTAGTWTLQDDLTCTGVYRVQAGTVDHNNKNATTVTASWSGGNLTLGTGILTVSGTSAGTNSYSFNCSGTTLSSTSSSIIRMTGNPSFNGRGYSYGRLEITGNNIAPNPAYAEFKGANTFGDFICAPTGTSSYGIVFLDNQTITDTLKIVGPGLQYRIGIFGKKLSGNVTLTAGTHIYDNADFLNVNTDDAVNLSSLSIGNCGENGANITFPTPVKRYWIGTSGGSWSSTSMWSTTSGGGSGASAPLVSDTAVFDAASFNSNGMTITEDVLTFSKVDLTNLDQTVIFNSVSAGPSMKFFTKDINFSNKVSTINISGKCFSINTNKSFNFGGKDPTGAIHIDMGNATGTFAGIAAGAYTMYSGTFLLGENCTILSMSNNGDLSGSTRYISFSSYTLTCTGNSAATFNTNNGITVTAGTGKLLFTGTPTSNQTLFLNGPSTNNYYNIEFTPAGSPSGSWVLNNLNVSNQLILGPKARIKHTAATTVAFGSTGTIISNATAGNLAIIGSSTTATYNYTKSSGTVNIDYVDIEYSAASGGGTFIAGCNSVNRGNNTGWTFQTCSTSNSFFGNDF